VDAEVPTVHDRAAIGGSDAGGEFLDVFDDYITTFNKKKGNILSHFECTVPIENSSISFVEVAFALLIGFLGGARRGAWRFIVQRPGVHRDILQRSVHGPKRRDIEAYQRR
jgi:hypothetical protein